MKLTLITESVETITTQWDQIPHYRGKPVLQLILHLYVDGVKIGYLEAIEDSDDQGYFYVDSVEISEDYRRQGYATKLYHGALQLVKDRGFKGLKSYKYGRYGYPDETPINKLWDKLKTRNSSDADYLEEVNNGKTLPS